MSLATFAFALDDDLQVARRARGAVRVTTRARVEGCTLVVFARMRAARAGDELARRFGGYDDEAVAIGPFDWDAGEHRVPFELPRLRGPASYRGRALHLAWELVAELRDESDDVIASATTPIEIGPRDGEPLPEDVVVGGYRDVPRAIPTAFEPALGSAHVEGVRPPKLTLGERVEGALFASRDLSAQLEARPARIEPGGAIDVTLFVYARTAANLQSARVALVHHERAEGISDVLTVADEPFTKAVELEPGHRRFKVRFTLPDDAAQSYADEAVATEWVLRAVAQPAWDAPIVLELVLSVV